MIKKVLNHRAVTVVSLVSLAVALGGSMWLFFALRAIGAGPFILNFNDIQGITRIGGIGDVVTMGVVAVLIVIVNFFLALELDERDPVLGKLVSGITLAGMVLLFIGFIAILNAN